MFVEAPGPVAPAISGVDVDGCCVDGWMDVKVWNVAWMLKVSKTAAKGQLTDHHV